MKIKAFAKINLILNVLAKRDDGFHEIESVMQTVKLADTIEINRNNIGRICYKSNSEELGSLENNLAYRAAELFFKATGLPGGINMELTKNIPVAAGLGGGSADAAAVLNLLNSIWDQPLKQMQLMKLASELGSDVPFFIVGGSAIARGRGELIESIPFIGKFLILLINPGFTVPTATIYSSINLNLTSNKPLHNILPALVTGEFPVEKLSTVIHNDLQLPVLRLFPEVNELLDWLAWNGACATAVSGSGGTVFGLFSDLIIAKKAAERASLMFPWTYLAESVPAMQL